MSAELTASEIKRLNEAFEVECEFAEWTRNRDYEVDMERIALKVQIAEAKREEARKCERDPDVLERMAEILDDQKLLAEAKRRLLAGAFSGSGGLSIFTDDEIIAARAVCRTSREAAKALGMDDAAFYNRIHRIKHNLPTRQMALKGRKRNNTP